MLSLGFFAFFLCAQVGPSQLEVEREVPPLSLWTEEDFRKCRYASYLLEGLMADSGLPTKAFRAKFFSLVIGMANALGGEEEPGKALARALKYFRQELGFHSCATAPTLKTLLPSSVLESRCGTDLVLTVLFLALMDRQVLPGDTTARFPLKPYYVPGALLLRYQFDTYHLNLLPSQGSVILSDTQVAERWPRKGPESILGVAYRELRVEEVAGLLLAELAEAYCRQGNQAMRERLLEKAVWLFPQSFQLRVKASILLLEEERPEEALKHINYLLERLADEPEPIYLKGVALFKQSRFREAKKFFERAIQLGYSAKGRAWVYLAKIASQFNSLPDLRKCLAALKAQKSHSRLTNYIRSLLQEAAAAKAAALLEKEAPYEKRFACVDYLVEHPGRTSVEALIRSLKDPNVSFRAYAWQALRRMTGASLPPRSEVWWEWFHKKFGKEKEGAWAEMQREIGPYEP